jgi:hypothetical protein
MTLVSFRCFRLAHLRLETEHGRAFQPTRILFRSFRGNYHFIGDFSYAFYLHLNHISRFKPDLWLFAGDNTAKNSQRRN